MPTSVTNAASTFSGVLRSRPCSSHPYVLRPSVMSTTTIASYSFIFHDQTVLDAANHLNEVCASAIFATMKRSPPLGLSPLLAIICSVHCEVLSARVIDEVHREGSLP